MNARAALRTSSLRRIAQGACVALGAALLSPVDADAQTRPPSAQPSPQAPSQPQPLEPVPPYEKQLLRLAEIMGALAWLTELCGDRPGDEWRKQMTSLMEAEATSAPRRERLAGSYNRGFRGYSAMHRRCTPSAELIITRFLDEGGRIARDVANRFSG
ncbi:MAG: TIGR02301 family protein [Beijerinckiaceae bacterium]